MYLFKQK